MKLIRGSVFFSTSFPPLFQGKVPPYLITSMLHGEEIGKLNIAHDTKALINDKEAPINITNLATEDLIGADDNNSNTIGTTFVTHPEIHMSVAADMQTSRFLERETPYTREDVVDNHEVDACSESDEENVDFSMDRSSNRK